MNKQKNQYSKNAAVLFVMTQSQHLITQQNIYFDLQVVFFSPTGYNWLTTQLAINNDFLDISHK